MYKEDVYILSIYNNKLLDLFIVLTLLHRTSLFYLR